MFYKKRIEELEDAVKTLNKENKKAKERIEDAEGILKIVDDFSRLPRREYNPLSDYISSLYFSETIRPYKKSVILDALIDYLGVELKEETTSTKFAKKTVMTTFGTTYNSDDLATMIDDTLKSEIKRKYTKKKGGKKLSNEDSYIHERG